VELMKDIDDAESRAELVDLAEELLNVLFDSVSSSKLCAKVTSVVCFTLMINRPCSSFKTKSGALSARFTSTA
jgi:hypothetical protein